MRTNSKTALLFCLLTLSGSIYAQSSSDEVLSQKADEAITALRREMKIPGTSVAVVRDGKIIKAAGYGLANIELNVPVTPETIFQAGSTGKQFLATAILLLAEEGKLSLDDRDDILIMGSSGPARAGSELISSKPYAGQMF